MEDKTSVTTQEPSNIVVKDTQQLRIIGIQKVKAKVNNKTNFSVISFMMEDQDGNKFEAYGAYMPNYEHRFEHAFRVLHLINPFEKEK
jgi:hypothetical protein